MSQSQLSSSEIAKRGEALFQQQIRSRLDPNTHGKFLVLDVETGEYEIDRDELAALKRARVKRPGAPLYVLRVGYATAYRIGRHATAASRC